MCTSSPHYTTSLECWHCRYHQSTAHGYNQNSLGRYRSEEEARKEEGGEEAEQKKKMEKKGKKKSKAVEEDAIDEGE
jgi:hypothetical protein